MSKTEKNTPPKKDYMLMTCICITGIYLTFAVVWLWDDFAGFREMDPNELGDTMAGIFAPPAFFWLIYGYFQQGKELKLNTKALKLQGEELKNTVEEQKKLVKQATKQNEIEEKKHLSSIKPDLRYTHGRQDHKIDTTPSGQVIKSHIIYELTFHRRGTNIPKSIDGIYLYNQERNVTIASERSTKEANTSMIIFRFLINGEAPMNSFIFLLKYTDKENNSYEEKYELTLEKNKYILAKDV